MNKILLVYEDYSELMSLEGLLKRVGFDVIGLTSEYSVAEQVLAFNPDVVIGSGRGGKVSSLGVGKRLKEMTRWTGKCVLIFPPGIKPPSQELMRIRVDMILEAPVINARVVQIVGTLLGANETELLEKLAKLSSSESGAREFQKTFSSAGNPNRTPEETIYIRGSSSPASSEEVKPESQDVEASVQKEKEKGKFKFELNNEAPGLSKKVPSENSALSKVSPDSNFADVDIKALEQELLKGSVAPTASENRETKSRKPKDQTTENIHGSSQDPVAPETRLLNNADEADSEVFSAASLEEELKNFAVATETTFDPLDSLASNQNQNLQSESPQAEDSEAETFDLAALEKELLAAAPPDEPDSAFSQTSLEAVTADLTEIQMKALEDLANATELLRKKMAKYGQIAEEVKLSPKSTVSRVEARRRQKDLQKDWDLDKMKDNDQLRRAFTAALFKK